MLVPAELARDVQVLRLVDKYRIVFTRLGHTFVWECTPETRRECLFWVVQAAVDDATTMTMCDAECVLCAIEKWVPDIDAEPVESYRDDYDDWFGPDDVPSMAWCWVVLVGSFGCWVGIYFAVRAWL